MCLPGLDRRANLDRLLLADHVREALEAVEGDVLERRAARQKERFFVVAARVDLEQDLSLDGLVFLRPDDSVCVAVVVVASPVDRSPAVHGTG